MIKTMLQSAIDRRELYQGRLVDNMANVIYFTKEIETTTPDTKERVSAKEALVGSEKEVQNDIKVLAAFDVLIEQMEKEASVGTLKTKNNTKAAGYNVK